MNEQIKELIEQATTKREFYPAGSNGYPQYRYDFDQEKFAELIVGKCLEIINNPLSYNKCVYTTHDKGQASWFANEVSKKIVESFDYNGSFTQISR